MIDGSLNAALYNAQADRDWRCSLSAHDAKFSSPNPFSELDKSFCAAIIRVSQMRHHGAGFMLDRRGFMVSGGAFALAQADAAAADSGTNIKHDGAEAPKNTAADPLYALTPGEAEFLTAVVDAFIPADDLSPSGSECGVVVFIDRQLAGAYGAGARLYQEGPFQPGNGQSQFGPQSPLPPLQFIQLGIAELDTWSMANGNVPVRQLAKPELNTLLQNLEAGKIALPRIDARAFFSALLQLTMEGFFSDPIYGGNRDKASWRMIGYPGLPATYSKAIKQYRGRRYQAEPRSIADFL
jgi:gluconate 2-dehydrogenase gamma chain